MIPSMLFSSSYLSDINVTIDVVFGRFIVFLLAKLPMLDMMVDAFRFLALCRFDGDGAVDNHDDVWTDKELC